MKKILLIMMPLLISNSRTFAGGGLNNTRNDLHIIPETKYTTDELKKVVDDIGNNEGTGTVLDRYYEQGKEIEKTGDIGTAFATGVFNRNILISYIAYVMRFLSQLGLLIGGIMVVYAGYQYATTVFGTGDPATAKSAITNAIKGVLVVVCSYAIRKLLVSMFIS